ncbi:PGC-1 and ERR-induced regulator in muscle protein 1-like isoform X7 [Apus apus]|uniref:PGC-1 and ERR-induced regulator in muscle protein 1-like isoform X7 n=1 Tax=Apus apus TaxID=8895 RepID=UPI0021F82740|nr:PGC-1 and ERR-induced regulator in muscle protein 1-like isoform X7 [Apus apus]
MSLCPLHSLVHGRLDHGYPSIMSHPGSTSTGEAGADGARKLPSLLAAICCCSPVPGAPGPSLVLKTSMRMKRRTGDGHPMTFPHHPPGTMKETSTNLRTGTRLLLWTPDLSLALTTSMGMRRRRHGHPTTLLHPRLGMTEKTSENLRAALESSGTREPGGFQDDCPPLGYRGLPGRRYRRLRRDHRDVIVVQRLPCSPRPSRGTRPPPRSAPPRSPPRSRRSQPVIKEEPQNPDPSQPLLLKDGAQRREETAQVVGFLPHLVPATTSETSLHRLSPARCRPVTNQPGFPQGPPVGQGEFPKAPRPADTPQKSPAADSQAAREAVEPEQAAGATPVEPGAEQTPVDSKDPSALEIEPVPPEESSAGPGEHHEVEPRSPSVPRAGAGGRSRSQIPAATPEPAERVHVVSISRREVGVELCPPSQGQQCQLSGAGDAEAEASKHGLLSNLQPTQNSLGATAEPDVEPSQASSNVCTKPDTSPGTQHPPGSGDTELAAGGRPWLCSALPTPVPAGTDLRSAAVLARKEEIELSYQQFSLTIAVVATMLLAKEPSMEAALGLALRANLRQGRIHHLQELEDFINSYDSATLSP